MRHRDILAYKNHLDRSEVLETSFRPEFGITNILIIVVIIVYISITMTSYENIILN